ncbi:MAG: DUF362 domain-containing protein [Spirochaetaceae bacterium]|jgi:uncharacterized protein (DUF362 family)|nr:DUF362 domain-containing protein [Spirochaetaceae bacterium]
MDRREFLKKTATIGFGAGLYFFPKGLRDTARLAAQEAKQASAYPALVAVKGGTPAAMFDRGMKALGGMGRFVKNGQTVAVKPNMSWDLAPEYAANTSPELVAAVVKHCRDAGAKKVIILDHSLDYWERAAKTSGILPAAIAAGAVYAPAETEGYYHKMNINGKRLKEVAVHEALLETDVLISVPVLKHHGGAGLTGSMKNLMGCVWNRRVYHSSGLQTCIADFLYAKKPTLNVIDAYRVLIRNGPRGGSLADVVSTGSLIISPDIVAADTAASMLVGRKQGEVECVRIAAEAGFGQLDLSKLAIERLTV